MSKPHKFATVIVLFLYLVGCGGGGGGGGDDDGDDGDVFPTPTLPAGAAKIDATNAEAIANSALEFTGILFGFALKTEGPPSIPQVIKLVTDQATKRNRILGSVAAGKTEDVSADFCNSGTATDTFTDTSDGASENISGEIVFSDCDLGGLLLNGNFPYELSANDATLDFDVHYGGSLIFSVGTDTITVVMNYTESGNDGTGDFSLTPSFSLDGIPDEGYLVTTVMPLLGNFFVAEFTSGELNVEGADNTQLCMTVTAINLVTVEFDDGLGGGCVPLVPQLDIPI
jgi:hypothetical protein